MSLFLRSVMFAALIGIAGCANEPTSNTHSDAPIPVKSVDAKGCAAKSKDAPAESAIFGTPAKNSKFAKLKLGNTFREVTDLIGAPDDIRRHETGKRWIPFYYGGDAQRMPVYYKGEGWPYLYRG